MVRVHKLISDDQDLEFTKEKKPMITLLVSVIIGALIWSLAYVSITYNDLFTGKEIMFSGAVAVIVTVFYYYAEEVYSFFSFKYVKN